MTHNPSLELEPSSSPLRIAIVSSDPLVRAGISAALEHSVGSEIVTFDLADVAVWDFGATSSQVDEALDEVGGVSIPVVAVLPAAAAANRALAAGVRGVVLRSGVGPHLVAALAAAHVGLTVLDPALAEELVDDRADRGNAPDSRVDQGADVEPLTARELEVIELLAEGLSNRRIARRLAISEHTVKFHMNGIFGKLAADTRTEAVVEALRRGILAL